MKLTPLDIHHKEFRHSLRGYSEEEVDQFLDEVADEFERLFKENIDLSERLEAAIDKVRSYQDMEKTLHNTMLAAQRSAEDIIEKSKDESTALLRDAEVKAKEIIHNALQQKQKVSAELVRIKQAEEEFRARFRSMLESHVSSLTEIGLPDDITVLMGDTDDGVVGDVTVGAPVVPAPAPTPAPVSAAPAAPEPAAQPSPVEEPPASGFVESVSLGETANPDLGIDDEPVFIDPKEFPSFDQLGEREDDLDIEEID